MSVREAAARLGISPAQVRKRIGDRSLVAVRSDRKWRIPVFQFVGDRLAPGLHIVLRALPADLHPLEVLGWLLGPEPDLEVGGSSVSPLAWIKAAGDPSRAAALARDL